MHGFNIFYCLTLQTSFILSVNTVVSSGSEVLLY